MSLLGFGRDTIKEKGVTLDRVWEQSQFLSNVFDNLFVQESTKLKTYEQFLEIVKFMEQRNILSIEDGLLKYSTPKDKPNGLVFLCSLIWPFIDSYWLTIVYIYTLFPDKTVEESKIRSKIQWFAENLYEDKIILHYESCSFDFIGKAVDYYITDGLL